MKKEKLVRLTVRVPENFADKIKKAADAKRWSINTLIEESLLEYVN